MSSNNAVEREGWSGRFGAIMSMAGMAIGLGNVWRFPYLVGAYGGGAFVFAYLVCLILIAIPLAFVEAGLGKGIQGGNLDAWSEILRSKRGGKLVGSAFSISYATMNFFYMSVTAGAIYFVYSFATNMKTKMAPEKIYDFMQTEQTGAMLFLTALVTIFMIVLLYFNSFIQS